MCMPALGAIGMGLQMAGQVAGFANQSHQTDLYNAAAKQNAINASLAAERQYEDEGRKFIYNSREIQQEGYQAAMKGRQAVGTTMASAGGAGFDASSISLSDIISSENQKTAQSIDNIKTKEDDQKNTLKSADDSSFAQAQGRINSMPYKASPSALGLAIGLGSDLVGGIKGSPGAEASFNGMFGT